MKLENILLQCVSVTMVFSGVYPLIHIFIGRDFEAAVLIVFCLLLIFDGAGLLMRERWAYRWANALLVILIAVLFLAPAEQLYRYTYSQKVCYWVLGFLYVLFFAVLNLTSVRKLMKGS